MPKPSGIRKFLPGIPGRKLSAVLPSKPKFALISTADSQAVSLNPSADSTDESGNEAYCGK